MNRASPDPAAMMAGIVAAVTLIGGSQIMIALLRWMTAK